MAAMRPGWVITDLMDVIGLGELFGFVVGELADEQIRRLWKR
jgi:hypothetical protein